jgi:dGTPase
MARWSQLVTSERLRPPTGPPAPGDEGNDFLSDYYRVVFASSFRRLQDKTQVKPLAETDYVRRRLTHSFEVAAVGERMGRVVARRLADRVAIPDERDAFGKIVATACLLHDIGNPPFGHEGELAVREWADKEAPDAVDYRCFDGNAQGFRIAVRLQHLGDPFGMNLTAATLSSMLKYPVTPARDWIDENSSVSKRGKSSVLSSEFAHYQRCAKLVGLELGIRHPLSYLVEAADDIVNRLVDIEDAIKLRLVKYDEVCEAIRVVAKDLLDLMEGRRKSISFGTDSERQLWAYQYFRVKATTDLAKACEQAFVDQINQLETGEFRGDLISACERFPLYEAIKQLEYSKIFGDADIVRTEAGGRRAIGGLLDIFYHELQRDSKLSKTMPVPPYSDIDLAEDPHLQVRRVVDYVVGMTDRYAIDLFQELSGMSL